MTEPDKSAFSESGFRRFPVAENPVFRAMGFHGVKKVLDCSNLLDFGTFGRHRGGIAKEARKT
jgi:hypothetical protein